MAQAYDQRYGARPLRRWLEHSIVTPLSRMIVGGEHGGACLLLGALRSRTLHSRTAAPQRLLPAAAHAARVLDCPCANLTNLLTVSQVPLRVGRLSVHTSNKLTVLPPPPPLQDSCPMTARW